MKLKKILKNINTIQVKGSKEIDITGVFSHSKVVFPGSIFIAKQGKTTNGNHFIQNAISNGASCIILDMYNPFLSGVTQVIVEDPREVEAQICANFFSSPSQDLLMVGITGTCGKTTTSYYTKHLLEGEDITGLIGTIETDTHLKKFKSSYTTPELPELMKIHKEMKIAGCKNCVMEVSSHAIDQKRIEQTYFDVVVFLNLSKEHLDYHKTMKEYKETKKKLLHHRKKDAIVVVSNENDFGREINTQIKDAVTFGFTDKADVYAKNVDFHKKGTDFDLFIGEEKRSVFIPAFGSFNVENALAAAATAYSLGVCLDQIQERLGFLPPISGRMEKIASKDGIDIIVDYAHKVDSMEKVLTLLKKIYDEKVIVVFGCGGDRDREKRPVMGRLVEKYANFAIITNDNPRSEKPEDIVKEIQSGMSNSKYIVELDRKLAMEKAFEVANYGDVILLAGKGHEEDQEIGGIKHKLSDRKLARDIAGVL